MQFEGGDVPCPDESKELVGKVLDWPAVFDPRRIHCTMPFAGNPCHHLVVTAGTPRGTYGISVDDRVLLHQIGFSL